MQNSSARSVKSSIRSRSAACSTGSSSERWILADWIAAPSSGGWTGPEKIIGPPVVRTLRSTRRWGRRSRRPRWRTTCSASTATIRRGCMPERVQRRAAAVLARPADAVGVVDVDVQLLVAVQQRAQLLERARSRRTSSRRRRPCTRCGVRRRRGARSSPRAAPCCCGGSARRSCP